MSRCVCCFATVSLQDFFEACPPPKIRIRECEGVSNDDGDGNGIDNGDGIVNGNCGGGRVSWFFNFRVSWFFNFRVVRASSFLIEASIAIHN